MHSLEQEARCIASNIPESPLKLGQRELSPLRCPARDYHKALYLVKAAGSSFQQRGAGLSRRQCWTDPQLLRTAQGSTRLRTKKMGRPLSYTGDPDAPHLTTEARRWATACLHCSWTLRTVGFCCTLCASSLQSCRWTGRTPLAGKSSGALPTERVLGASSRGGSKRWRR